MAYDAYAHSTLEHGPTMRALKHSLHEAGVIGGEADRAALGAIRRELDVEAVASGFRDSFLLLSLFFILGCLPLVYITVLRLIGRKRGAKPLIVMAARP
jgi:hypothetical protein